MLKAQSKLLAGLVLHRDREEVAASGMAILG